jgi:hypothetical protein
LEADSRKFLKAIGISSDKADARVEHGLDTDLLDAGSRPQSLHGIADDLVEMQGLHLEVNLAGNDSAHIEQVVHDL